MKVFWKGWERNRHLGQMKNGEDGVSVGVSPQIRNETFW